MREIKFRGKSVDNSKWVYGSYLQRYNHSLDDEWLEHYIVDDLGYEYEVIPETVGQYTGLHDKNGVEIYEGDRVRLDLNNEGYKNTKVVYRNNYMQFMFDHPKEVYTMTEYHFKPKDLEIIGNIHEEVK